MMVPQKVVFGFAVGVLLVLSSGLARAQSSILGDQLSPDAEESEAKSVPNITGSWSGDIYDSTHEGSTEGDFNMEVTQTKNKVTGSWNAFSGANEGELVGTVSSKEISLSFYVPVEGHLKCHITIKSKPASTTSISGSFPHVSSCGPSYKGEHGTITMTNDSPD
jgi:hypothetical protein